MTPIATGTDGLRKLVILSEEADKYLTPYLFTNASPWFYLHGTCLGKRFVHSLAYVTQEDPSCAWSSQREHPACSDMDAGKHPCTSRALVTVP